jgi:geranylgeranyl reductase family protein
MPEEILDVFVVGGALSGPRTAELIAESGKNVMLVEENFDVGHPCKCTGLVSWRIKELLPTLPEKLIVNTHREARFHSPNGSSFVLKSRKPVYLLDRPGLDRYLFDLAQEAGVETRKSEKFLSYKLMDDHIEVETDKKTYKTKILIGADGANSSVGKQAGFVYPENYLVGVQTTAHGNFDKVELWFGSKVSPNFFAWVAPENENIARVGLATNRNSSKYYEGFLKSRVGDFVKPDVGGVIRFGLMERTSTDRVMVVGDAACQVKPYSGGGIIFGITASKVCAEAAVNALRQKKFGEKFFKENYDDVWKSKIGGAIKRGMMLNRMMRSSDTKVSFMMKVGRLGTRLLSRMDMDLINYFV